ncbi:MAG: hypothetical protein K6E46_03615 [Lachnospiraceae bacterium]|nr:hypothetical protein [Lachnospiraceae bacterium]
MLKRVKRRLISILIICAFTITTCCGWSCFTKAKENVIGIEYAKKMATIQIQSFIVNNEKDELSKWEWGVYIEEPVPMYSPDGCIEAYYIDVVDKAKNSIGYVIVGANKAHAPIIEYGICNEFYPAAMIKELGGDTFYYLGETFYMIGNKKEIWDVSDFGKCNCVERKNMKNVKVIRSDYSESWEYWEKFINSHKIIIGDNKIDEPSYKTELVNRTRQRDVNGYNQPYTVMNAFPGEESHCFPVASVNLFIYWTRFDGSHYSVLRQPNDRQWRQTFNILKQYMHTVNSSGVNGGTTPQNGVSGLTRYIRECGIHNLVQYIGNANKYTCMDEIDDGRPFIIDYEHPEFSRHAMLILGYRNESAFTMRAVDGSSGYAGRFFTIDNMYGIVTIEMY